MKTRLENFKKNLLQKKLAGFIVSNFYSIYYLTGFAGISPKEREAILAFNGKFMLIVPRLYQFEAANLSQTRFKVKIASQNLFKETVKLLPKNEEVGFEANDLKYAEYQFLKKLKPSLKLKAYDSLIEALRSVKDSDEISKIEKAQTISHQAFDRLLKVIKTGQTEAEIAVILASILKSLGADGTAFETIVAAGANSSRPHYLTGSEKIKKGQCLLLDFGAKYKGYCADTTRTIFIGPAKDEHKNIYQLVYDAHKKAINNISEKSRAKDVHNISNEIFKKARLDKFFTHSLGHGIGLEVHEAPRLSAKSKDKLTEGMVFSIEPGLYLPWGGVRIEDLVTITNGNAKILGKSDSRLIEI